MKNYRTYEIFSHEEPTKPMLRIYNVYKEDALSIPGEVQLMFNNLNKKEITSGTSALLIAEAFYHDTPQEEPYTGEAFVVLVK